MSINPLHLKKYFLEENIGNNLIDIAFSNVFVDLIPKARETNAKINKCNHIKLESCIIYNVILLSHKKTEILKIK